MLLNTSDSIWSLEKSSIILSKSLDTINLSLPYEINPIKQSKVFSLVMQVLTSLLNESSQINLYTSDGLANLSLEENLALVTNSTENYLDNLSKNSGIILIIICGIFFAIVTTIGNLMVMVSIKIDKQLQTISNYFLFSLAVADITIGFISIPLMTYYTANQYWGLGYISCQFWLSMDYLMSNASVLNLLLISFDRYFSVTKPLSYRPKRSTKKALLMIACTYIISAILWPPWIIGWPYIEGQFTIEPGACVVQFLETNPYVTVATALAAFYLPVSIMIALYSRVYRETKRRQRQFRLLQAGQMFCSSTEMGATSVIQQLSLPLLLLRGRPSETIQPENSSSCKNEKNSFRNKSMSSKENNLKEKERSNFHACLKYCTGKNEISSDESSDAGQATNYEDLSQNSSVYKKSRKSRPTLTEEDDKNIQKETPSPDRGNSLNGSLKFRTRKDRPLHTYTVLIELPDRNDKRPSVKLSTCENDMLKSQLPIDTTNNIMLNMGEKDHELRSKSFQQGSQKSFIQQQNGKHKFTSIDYKKSEKERRKNERKQESKAAKTLSAILCAFIITWTPYNVIVIWEAFFPKTIPGIIFTISYCLCYINSTINPLCYALCNARFRMTYMRILKCRWKKPKPNHSNLYRHAYLRRI